MPLIPNDSALKSENQGPEEEEGFGYDMKTYNKYKWFLFFTRKYKINDLVPPLDLKEAFSEFAGGETRLSGEQLRRFLVELQGHEDCTLSESEQIIDKILKLRSRNHETSGGGDHHQHGLTLEDVFYFLLFDDFNSPLKAEVSSLSLSSLSFCVFGHNSYLTGNQLSSDCSDEPIIKALQRGVRAIELDLWPTPNKDDIKVVHGWTLTNPVSPIKCLEAIKKNAFVTSQYPVIVTIEDHLTPDLQSKFAENGSDKDKESINACDHKSDQQCPPDYKGLITIHAKKLKGSLKDKLRIDDEVRRLSWNEQTLEKASESHGTDIVRFTQKNILRVYPRGTRVQSSNFKPHIGWMYGAQMVAFNMQRHDKQLWLMQGMFRANGGCGYVKKPQIVMQKLQNDEEFDPKRTLPVKKTLKVKVYLGYGWSTDFKPTHFDKCSPPDFYTKVRIVGVPADCGKRKTRVKMDNWFPVWDEEFEFPLSVPELALLRIVVREKNQGKDEFGGQTCLPVSELRLGFRAVPLYNRKGEKYKSVKLLMRFQFV
ncbi:phosphoinositide phospholipase C 6-like [Senna tora]|uniref:Phosphoinositide phospholipase C n=1 Tax=Senna tora TaxID=362788 RepID=A0A834TYJ2_9FABA|nr:phosphoinositide phospholipase C 6-like [Senna tora]